MKQVEGNEKGHEEGKDINTSGGDRISKGNSKQKCLLLDLTKTGVGGRRAGTLGCVLVNFSGKT